MSNTSLHTQLLCVVSAIDTEKACRPQIQMIFDASRDVFDIVETQRRNPNALQLRRNSIRSPFDRDKPPVSMSWPDLTLSPGATPDARSQTGIKALWGEHVPTQQDWLKYIILLHPAMQEIVSAEFANGAEVRQPENSPEPFNRDENSPEPFPGDEDSLEKRSSP